jgi:hypothetical protein
LGIVKVSIYIFVGVKTFPVKSSYFYSL